MRGTDDGARGRSVLSALLRGRPVTTAEAVALLGLPEPEVRALLAGLVAEEQIVWDGDVLGYESPERRAVAAVTRRMEHVRSVLSEIEGVLGELPPLVESWVAGAASGTNPVEVIRGRVPIAEVWTRQFSFGIPSEIRMFLPDPVAADQVGQESDAAEEFMRKMSLPVRCLVRGTDYDEADPGRPFAHMPPSVAIRIEPRVPGWMMVGGDTLVLPSQWGRTDLVDLVLVNHAALAAAMADYFDLLWSEAVPVPGRGGPDEVENTWDPLLVMLNQGLTIEAAGRAIGLSPRTAQRRVHQAMSHFGVTSHFALAAAWERSRRSRR